MMKYDRMLFMTCLALLSAGLLFTQPLEASGKAFLDRFEGAWIGDGKAFGNTARLQMKWEWVLERKFLRLSLKNEMRTTGGQRQVFEGQAYYKLTDAEKCAGTWFDSQGASYQIRGSFSGDALTVLWGASGQERGKSVYRFLEAGKLEVVDSVKQKDGTWKEFGTFVVMRQ